MKKSLLFCLLVSIATSVFAQLQSSEHLGTYSVEDLQVIAEDLSVPAFILTPEYVVDAYKLTYQTPDVHGNPTTATGALVIPRDVECPLPLTSYQHGTVALKTGVPSYMSPEFTVGLLFASAGYNVCEPDYLGLGDSPGFHPYVHAKSQASASIDMIRASKEFAAQEGVEFSEQLMLFGYSQGGHATMATYKELQENHPDLPVSLCVPMAGPYDVSGVQTSVIVSDEPYATPGYLPYVLFSYQSVYGNLFSDPSEIFVAPYDELLPTILDGEHSMGEINQMCTPVPKDMLKPEVVDSFIMDQNHRFRVALRDNDLYDWVPQSPTRILYCNADDQVNFMNSVVADQAFQDNGAPDVETFDLGAYDHADCFPFAIFRCKLMFDENRNACTTSTRTPSFSNLKISPNPTSGAVDIQLPTANEAYHLKVYTLNGQQVLDVPKVVGENYTIEAQALDPGMYMITLVGEKAYRQKLLRL